ncbi:hypothetical protein CVS40_6746, partial [Lucilia cuprina]
AFINFIGAIDETHIRIKCPTRKHDEYINHKKFHSIHVQEYPCQLYPVPVITPFKDPLTPNQARFNIAHGAIDETHIRIKCPTRKHDEYINHKKFHSIHVQV